MKKILSLLFLVPIAQFTSAQFILKGKIEYEKTVNIHKQLGDDSWVAQFKKNIPEFQISYFNLSFNNEKALYEPGREVQEKRNPFMGDAPASSNIVFSDFTTEQGVTFKQVFDEAFLIQDSLKKYKWRITNDTRKIAGFDCRRATTVIMDSVFVVAFYTDEIVAPGGPESFNGLPGMILGVVIPRLYTNWYATRIELETVKETAIAPPKKGRKTTTVAGMEKTVLESLKRWGEWGQRYLWQILI
ncbi:MAG: GLPGLI family protein [Chitinophagaceae bacterium]|nr:GLPGLI family protein [Chitinophagaceae bacterium]MCW5926202.1 GLPGLI family protein [Chitinophagaceae bacterium]